MLRFVVPPHSSSSVIWRCTHFRPREVSSKKPVPRFQEVIQLKKHDEIRDPRFDERTGSFNEGLFKKSYAFLDEVKRSEKQLVEREAKKARNPEKRAKLQTLIQQMVRTVPND